MLKFILYVSLTLAVSLAALVDPIGGVIAVISAYLWNPAFIQIPNYGLPLRFELVTSLAFIGGWLLHRPRGTPGVGPEGAALASIWIFTFIAVASALWAQVSPQSSLDKSFEVLKTVLVVSLMVPAIRSERHLDWVMTACLVGLFHASFMHTLGYDIGYVGSSHAREYGVLSDTQTAVEVLFFPLLGLVAIRGSTRQKIFCLLAIPIVLNSIIESYTRSYTVALAAEVAVLALLLPKRLVLKLAPVGLVLGGLAIFVLTPQNWWDRMKTIQAPTEEGSANSRFVIAEASVRMFLDYPILGVGYRNYPSVSPRYLPESLLTTSSSGAQVRSAHNSFFTVLCETGMVGFSFWAFAFATTMWTLRQVRKRADSRSPSRLEIYAMGLEVGMIGWMVAGLFHSEHESDPAYWVIAFAIVMIRLQAQAAQKRAAEESEAAVPEPSTKRLPKTQVAARSPLLSR